MTFSGSSLPGKLQGGMSGPKRGKKFNLFEFLNEGRKLGEQQKKDRLKAKKKKDK